MSETPACPIRPLTAAQVKVADLVGRGLDAKDVAKRLNVEPSTIRAHVISIAALLPNPDHLGAYRLVMLWAAQERWVREYHPTPKSA